MGLQDVLMMSLGYSAIDDDSVVSLVDREIHHSRPCDIPQVKAVLVEVVGQYSGNAVC